LPENEITQHRMAKKQKPAGATHPKEHQTLQHKSREHSTVAFIPERFEPKNTT